MSSYSVYLFRHIQTQQVLVSTRQSMKNKALRQIETTLRPVRLRKDHWRPMVALTGIETPQSAQALSDALLQRSQARQLDLKTSAEHLARPKRLRVVDEKNMLEQSVQSLREALESVAPQHFKDKKVLALWEQPHFMDLKGQQEWPAFVEHGQLELRLNRLVNNPSS
ncbi:uncharacterized protein BYT42DRAFT_599724 [Radiomyces spectabilis]|uniref:uncharacterized protein n=1 Tax=Radiomyces spectabilis TaxID=64574 RepID=UPI00221EBE25|nr:uncharacterized protein BYT42DRAFT_599724 [Radiomyces spectabilis]KAI8373107.1 hypothetical protein BYT42DRAFT_599724 [Radiomyces spectabilis]